MSQTVVVERVVPTRGDWFEVHFEDGSKASTKNPAIAEAAEASVGDQVLAVINSKQNGNFTNYYLNQIGDVKDAPAKAKPRTAKSMTTPAAGPDDRDKRISTQWAYGRSVELLMASGRDFDLPLDEDTQAVLESTAAWLLSKL